MTIPFLDLKTASKKVWPEIQPLFEEIVGQAAFVGGPYVKQFEEEFSSFCETRICVGVGSGTDALRFALLASGIQLGDEVITVPNTFIATTEAITQAGARPVFVDVDPRTYNIDVGKVEAAITPRTKAILPVHLYGQCADMLAIKKIADKHKLTSIAFPALGTGVGGFPPGQAAEAMLGAVMEHLKAGATSLRKIVFVLYQDEAFKAFNETLTRLRAV
jgi:dTDP-4-amino-4,6-dideoxygalactose transaminase